MKNLPSEMAVLSLPAYAEDQEAAIRNLEIGTRNVPRPGPGQVLVRIAGAPVNPSDLLFLTGNYNVTKTLPCVPGFEGLGTIVAKGSGFFPWLRVGKRVACGGQADREGTWGEYFIAESTSYLPLSDKLPDSQAPFMLINPLTALGMLDRVRALGSRAFVHSAAASQLGLMLAGFARIYGLDCISIVRREEQVNMLKERGQKHVLNSSDPDFAKQLGELSRKLNAKVALDAISGDFTSVLVSELPDQSHILLYGTLGGNYMNNLYSRAFSYGQKTLSGFNLKQWSDQQSMLKKLGLFRKAQKLIASGEIATEIRRETNFEGAVEAILDYAGNMTGGKVVIRPGA